MQDKLKGTWRLIQPFKAFGIKYPFSIWKAYARFYKSWVDYKRKGGKLSFRYIYPSLYFKQEDVQTGGGHYFYQDIWALKKLAALQPAVHYDVGSRFDGFVGQATAICKVTALDIREPSFKLPGLDFLQADILDLPLKTNSITSLSCLHTIEHIGLGRYGDVINPEGYNNALSELQRVVAQGGHLILSMPVGDARTEFNAQRILDPSDCIQKLSGMQLIEFSVVNDRDEYLENVQPDNYTTARYACGLYLFKKL